MEVSPALVSAVTDVVADEITEWQNRPLDAFYAILYIDALVVKVRDGGAVDNKAAYLVTAGRSTPERNRTSHHEAASEWL